MNKTTDTYLSLNKEELIRLWSLSHEALGLYMRLKEKANFRTGVVGKFFNQKLRYATFAKMMGRPASQGREERRFDTTDIKRLLAQLESVGLVEEHDWDGTRLTMRLPFSPLWKNNPELPNGKPKLPYGSQEKTSQSPAQQGIGDGGDAFAAASESHMVGGGGSNRYRATNRRRQGGFGFSTACADFRTVADDRHRGRCRRIPVGCQMRHNFLQHIDAMHSGTMRVRTDTEQ